MILETTKVFDKVVVGAKESRNVIVYGGSSASKTVSIIQYLILYALKHPSSEIGIVAQSVPVIKKTVLRDFKRIMGDLWDSERFNKMDLQYSFANGSFIEFVNADDADRFQAYRPHIAYIDEAYKVSKEVYMQLNMRVKKLILMSFNPVSKFWASDLFDNATVIHATYKDNPFAGDVVIKELERLAELDTNFYRVYTQGEWGSYEGLVFEENKNWKLCKRIPESAILLGIGHDWGFGVDQAATIELWTLDNVLYAREIVYEKGLLYSQLADRWKVAGVEAGDKIVADASSPQGIAEMKKLGFYVVKGDSSNGAILYGIKMIKQQPILIEEDSTNLISELRNYSWLKDKEGNQLGKPVDKYNHLIDALRYAVMHFIRKSRYAIR